MRIQSLTQLLPLFALLCACEPSTTQSPPVQSESGFRLYTVSMWHDAPYTDAFTLDSRGNAMRMVGHLDTIDTLKATLAPSALLRVKQLLESPSAHHPTPIAYPFQVSTHIDPSTGETLVDTVRIDGGSTTSRTIDYVDDSTSSMFAHSAVQHLPDSWTALDPVDSLLAALFPR